MTGSHDRRRWAEARGERLDRGWFDRRPDAFLRMRQAVPFEFDMGEEPVDGKFRFVIAFREKDGSIERRSFLAFQMPDQDLPTMSVLFDMLGEVGDLQGEIPADMLLRASLKITELRARQAAVVCNLIAAGLRR